MAYIDKEKAIELIKNFGKGAIEDGMKTLDPVDDIILLSSGVDLIPTADVVEVVRCKDCKNLMFSDFYGECSKGYMGIVSPDDYCSYGERKDGE